MRHGPAFLSMEANGGFGSSPDARGHAGQRRGSAETRHSRDRPSYSRRSSYGSPLSGYSHAEAQTARLRVVTDARRLDLEPELTAKIRLRLHEQLRCMRRTKLGRSCPRRLIHTHRCAVGCPE